MASQVAPGDGGKPPWAEEVDVHSHPSAAPPVAAPHAPPRAPAPGRGSLGGGAIGDDAATEEVPNMDLDRALALVLQARWESLVSSSRLPLTPTQPQGASQ